MLKPIFKTRITAAEVAGLANHYSKRDGGPGTVVFVALDDPRGEIKAKIAAAREKREAIYLVEAKPCEVKP